MLTAVFNCSFLLGVLQANKIGENHSQSALSYFFVFAGLIFLAPLGIGFFNSFKQKKRDKLFKAYAIQNGWEYLGGENDDTIYFSDADNYRLFKLGRGRGNDIYSLAYRPFENGRISVFDYYYERGSYKYSIDVMTTCLRVWSPNFLLPYFALYSESFFSSFGEMFGYNDIDFPAHPNFSARYKLSGKDEAGIRDLFPSKVIACFEQMPDIWIDGGGQSIYIYQLDHLEPIETLSRFAAEKIEFLNVLRQPR